MTVAATVLFALVCLLLWHEALVEHRRDRDSDMSGVFVAIGSLCAYGALLTSGVAGL